MTVIDVGLPIRTGRLQLRRPVAGDADALCRRRNEPAAAAFQSWNTPYSAEAAARLIDETSAMAGPTAGEWWMATVEADGVGIVGDIAVHLDHSATTVELGATFASAHWGQGYASEAAAAMMAALFDRHGPLVRIEARMHPDNLAAARVVERCGMVFEGQTKLSFPPPPTEPGQEPLERSDDRIYGIVRTDWEAWNARPTDPPKTIDLVEITAANFRAVEDVAVHKSQAHLVAPTVVSVAQASLDNTHDGVPLIPWLRAIEADGEIVGLVMVGFTDGDVQDPYLWRLAIDRRHQRRGIGDKVLDEVIALAREREAPQLFVSWMPGVGSPEPFYKRRGFVETGTVDGGEIEAVLQL